MEAESNFVLRSSVHSNLTNNGRSPEWLRQEPLLELLPEVASHYTDTRRHGGFMPKRGNQSSGSPKPTSVDKKYPKGQLRNTLDQQIIYR